VHLHGKVVQSGAGCSNGFVSGDYIFLDRPPAYQVLVDNPFEHLGLARVIPNAVGIYHCDGTMRAEAQAIYLASVNQWQRSNQL